MKSSRTLLAPLAVLALASLAACGGDDASASDGGPVRDLNTLATCPASDGTIASDCARFACQYRNASLTICPGATTLTFNCTGVEAFPAEYQAVIRNYFTECAPALSTIVPTQVMTTSGPVTIPACNILQCAASPATMRLFEGGPNMKAECAPVPAPACDFPDPPL